VNAYRTAGRERARTGGIVSATAFSAIEQALWDLTGQINGTPALSATRTMLPVYANINRATKPRTPEGFAATAKRAYDDGFRAFKAAPFDGFPPPGSPKKEIDDATDRGIAAMEAIRAAVGPDAQLMVDCHSFFDVPRAIAVAKRLEPVNLTWYEEPVAPERTADTAEIRRSIKQAMAGGEILFGVEGFTPLCTQAGIDVIMPDVKHCGGLLEMIHIAALADGYDVAVAPHNPSGPVSTAASVQVCAGMINFDILELQWGEAPWRGEIVDPPEVFTKGSITISSRPGFGIKLNEKLVRKYAL
jgi:galactonate dehydratase